jgi:hypothetical protein
MTGDAGARSRDQEQVAVYRETITDEIFHALGLSRRGMMRRWLGPLFRYPTGRFAEVIARADTEVMNSGLSGGSRRLIEDLSLWVAVRGADTIPERGPLLVASNHPGAYDSIAILSCLPRQDVKVIISDAGFTRALSAARRYFIFAPNGTGPRAAALRESLDHLRGGGSLLVFPHVEVEPDPETSADAWQTFRNWSRGVEVMLSHVPGVRLLLVMASGVLMPRFLHHPLAKVRRSLPIRQKLAEFLQVSQQMAFPKSVRPHIHLSFAPPVDRAEFDGKDTMPAVREMARRLFAEHRAAFRL